MEIWKRFIFILLLALVHFGVEGQSAEEKVAGIKQELQQQEEREGITDDPDSGKESSSRRWDLQVGTAYTFAKGYGSGMMLYAAPGYTLPLNNRWALHGGLLASGYRGMNPAPPGEDFYPATFTSLSLYAAASYRMNERLLLHGSGVKQLITAPATLFTPYPVDNLSLGATYRIGTNLTIGATIHMSNGPYYGYPGPGPGFPSTLHW